MKTEDYSEDNSENDSSGNDDCDYDEDEGSNSRDKYNESAPRKSRIDLSHSQPGPSSGKRKRSSSHDGSDLEYLMERSSVVHKESREKGKQKWHAWTHGEKIKLCLAIIEQKGQHDTAGNTLWDNIFYKHREDFHRHTSQSMKEQFRKRLRFNLDSYLSKEQAATFPDDIARQTRDRNLKTKSGSGAAYDDSTFIPMLNYIAAAGPNDSPNSLAFWDSLVALKIPVLVNRTGSALFQQYKLKIKNHLAIWKPLFEEKKFENISRKCLGVRLINEMLQNYKSTTSNDDIVQEGPTTLSKGEAERVARIMTGVKFLLSSKESSKEEEKFHAVTTFQILEFLVERANQLKQEKRKNK